MMLVKTWSHGTYTYIDHYLAYNDNEPVSYIAIRKDGSRYLFYEKGHEEFYSNKSVEILRIL